MTNFGGKQAKLCETLRKLSASEQNKFHACVLNVANQKIAVNKFVSYELFCPQVDIIYLIYIICYYRQLAIATLDWNRVER